MKRLNSERPFMKSLTFPADLDLEDFTVLYQNVRSLHAHFKDIDNDPNL